MTMQSKRLSDVASSDTNVADAAYRGYATWKGWKRPFGYSANDKAYFSGEFPSLRHGGRRVLEIGFGEGTFLAWARDAGNQVVGIEMLDELIEIGHQSGFEVYPAHDVDKVVGTFDAVVALDLFEHLSEQQIVNYLALAARCLNPDGTVILRFPNGISPFGRLFQYSDRTHISVLSPSVLKQMMQQFDLPLRIDRVKNPCYGIRYNRSPLLVLARSARHVVRLTLFRFISLAVGIPRHLDPNLVVHLRKSPDIEVAAGKGGPV